MMLSMRLDWRQMEKKAITYSCDISLPLYLLKRTLNSYVTILAIQSAFLII